MPRLFVAVWPPADLVGRLAALPRPDVPGLRWTTPEQWHVTLRFLGRVEEGQVESVVEALAGVAAAQAAQVVPVRAAAGPATGRFGHRVLHLPVDGLGGLARAVAAATAGVGEPPEDRAFSGHLTLARAKGRVNLRPLMGMPVAAAWPVDEVALVESRLSAAGARYDVVARFPLVGVAPN